MKERIPNNLGLKVLSIFFAFLVWLAVVNVSNPEVTRTKEVTLEILNEEVLQSADKTYEIGKNTVTVSYDIRTADVGSVRSSDFRAYIDLADLYDVTGSVPVIVEVLNNKDLISNPVAKPGVVRVELEDVQRKKFDLTYNPLGSPEDGYAVGSVVLEPETILVTGPVSAVGQISAVGIEFNAEGVNSDQIGVAAPVFYDANGNRLNLGERVSTNTRDISYEAQILRVKNLAIDFGIEGKVADGFRLTGVDSNIKSVAVVGSKSVLASVSTIAIPSSELNIDGANANKTVVVDISGYLPPGVSLVDEKQKEIAVVLKVEPLKTRRITLNAGQIVKTGGSDQYDYQLAPQSIEVTVGGLEDELSALKAEELGASVDLSGLAEGTHSLEVQFKTDDKYHVQGYTPLEVKVTAAPTIGTPSTEPGNSSTAAEPSDTAQPTGPSPATTSAATDTGEDTEVVGPAHTKHETSANTAG